MFLTSSHASASPYEPIFKKSGSGNINRLSPHLTEREINRSEKVSFPLLFILLLFMCLPINAFAGDTVLGFDEYSRGTVITNQYAGKGVVLNEGTVNTDFYTRLTPSAPNVLRATHQTGLEFPNSDISGTFSDPHHSKVGAFVRVPDPIASDAFVQLYAFDVANNKIASTTIRIPAGSVYAYGEVTSSSNNIASFQFKGLSTIFYGLDNLTFNDLTVPPIPDFHLNVPGDLIVLVPGGSTVGRTVTVDRLNGSTGNLTISVSGLPTGVFVQSIVPNPFNGPDKGTFTVNFGADFSGRPFQKIAVTIKATPVASAGTVAHSVTVPITVLDSYDARLVGMEVTQGIQVYDLPKKSNPLTSNPVAYSGVDFAKGGKTVVRLFGNLSMAPFFTPVPTQDYLLYGYRNGVLLPESPLVADGGTGNLKATGDVNVTDAVRAKTATAQFTLPLSWTQGVITLTATMKQAPSFFPSNRDVNLNNNDFTLTGISFTPVRDLSIYPFLLTIKKPGFTVRQPDVVFEEARNLLPVGDGQFDTGYYHGTVDITDIYDSITIMNDLGRGASCLARMRDVADDFNVSGKLIGVYPTANGRIRAQTSRGAAVVEDTDRPLSSVAHELGHLLGRKHASGAGGAADPQDWPPDQKGFLQGVGFDRRKGRIVFPDRTGGFLGGPYYDFMGYLGQNGNNDPDKWISVRGWQDTIHLTASGPAGQSAGPITEQSIVPVLTVRAYTDTAGNYHISKVAPSFGTPTSPDPSSPCTLVIYDLQGHVLSETSMLVSEIQDGAGQLFADGSVKFTPSMPFTSIGKIEIYEGSVLVAQRERSLHPPLVQSITVKPDVSKATGDVITTIQWNASGLNNPKLTAKVDYSVDGGNSWRILYYGANQNKVDLDAGFFAACPNALVRVRANDGFNESYAVSRPFRAKGRVPSVRILAPTSKARFPKRATILLSGIAFDDKHVPLDDTAMTWYLNSKLVATGKSALLTGLTKIGTYTLQLKAKDSVGRVGKKSITFDIRK